MKAFESPGMVHAFHGGGTLETASAKGRLRESYTSGNQSAPTISVHPAASPYTVMAGSILLAVLIGGINTDPPGPILAQVSQNVVDRATGRSVLIPLVAVTHGISPDSSTNARPFPLRRRSLAAHCTARQKTKPDRALSASIFSIWKVLADPSER